jgi:hypothetical protein
VSRLAKSDAGAAVVLIDEFNAGAEHRKRCLEGSLTARGAVPIASFCSPWRLCRGRLSLQPLVLARWGPDCVGCSNRGEANAGLITIGELDAGRLKCTLQRVNRPLLQFLSPLKPSNRVNRHLGRCSEVANAQPQGRTSHSTLHGQQNHINVPISVELSDFDAYRNKILNSV